MPEALPQIPTDPGHYRLGRCPEIPGGYWRPVTEQDYERDLNTADHVVDVTLCKVYPLLTLTD